MAHFIYKVAISEEKTIRTNVHSEAAPPLEIPMFWPVVKAGQRKSCREICLMEVLSRRPINERPSDGSPVVKDGRWKGRIIESRDENQRPDRHTASFDRYKRIEVTLC